jgi:hypothetical protein
MQNFYRVSHAIEDLVGITDDKYYPHIGIIRPIAAVWMVFELGYCLANACRYIPRAAADRPLKYSIIRSRSEKAAGV